MGLVKCGVSEEKLELLLKKAENGDAVVQKEPEGRDGKCISVLQDANGGNDCDSWK